MEKYVGISNTHRKRTPLEHFEEKGEKEKREDFLKFLGEFVVEEKYVSSLLMDPDAFNPRSEITIENEKLKN